MAYRVQTLNNISTRGLERLPRERYEVASALTDPDAILVRSADMHSFDVPATVVAVARAGAGTNNIPVARLSKRGIPVFNAPGANAKYVSCAVRGLPMSFRQLEKQGCFSQQRSRDGRSTVHALSVDKARARYRKDIGSPRTAQATDATDADVS